MKVSGIGSPSMSSEEVAINDLLKRVTANESAVVHVSIQKKNYYNLLPCVFLKPIILTHSALCWKILINTYNICRTVRIHINSKDR